METYSSAKAINEVGSSSLTMIVDSRKKCSDLVLARNEVHQEPNNQLYVPRIDDFGAPISLWL
jgi:hypothetical protein